MQRDTKRGAVAPSTKCEIRGKRKARQRGAVVATAAPPGKPSPAILCETPSASPASRFPPRCSRLAPLFLPSARPFCLAFPPLLPSARPEGGGNSWRPSFPCEITEIACVFAPFFRVLAAGFDRKITLFFRNLAPSFP